MAATVNNVIIPNIAKGVGDRDVFPGIHALTRALKKAGWKVRATSDAGSVLVSDAPELDKWGTGTTTGVSGTGQTVSAVVNGRCNVSDLSGIGGTAINPHKGMFLRMAGGAAAGNNHDHQIEEIISATEVRIDARRAAFTPGVDGNNGLGGFTWEIFDPTEGLAPAQPFASATHAWIVLEGPRVIKVPITSAPVAGTDFDFIRGENVTQAVTGAEGEFLSYVFDSGAGYMCIAPRVYGSGGDPTGWATTRAITGDTSGATVTQVGTAVEYVMQLVIMKDGNFEDGYMAIQCIDPVGETAADWAVLAASAGAGVGVAPGQGGTDNAFPADPLASIMLANSDVTLGEEWCGDSSNIMGNTQVMCVDAIPEAKHSGEGSWVQAIHHQTDGVGAHGHAMYLMLDGEPGDQLCPYVWQSAAGNAAQTVGNGTARRATAPDGTPTADTWGGLTHEVQYATSDVHYRTFRGRGSGLAADTFITLEYCQFKTWSQTDDRSPHTIDSGLPFTVQTSPVSPLPKMRSPIWVGHFNSNTNKFIKGRFKNLTQVSLGGFLDTYDSGTAIQLSGAVGPFVWEPWDGVTIAVAS